MGSTLRAHGSGRVREDCPRVASGSLWPLDTATSHSGPGALRRLPVEAPARNCRE